VAGLGGAGIGSLLAGGTPAAGEAIGTGAGLTSGIEGLAPTVNSAITGLGGEAAAGGAAESGAAGAGIGSSLGAAAAGIGVGAGLAGLAAELLLNVGPSQNNIPASQWNQQILAAGDDILAAAKRGQISEPQAQKALRTLLDTAKSGWASPLPQGWNPALASHPAGFGSPQFANAQQNAMTNLNALLAALPNRGLAPGASITGAQAAYLPANTPGWYPGSLSTGADIATNLLTGNWEGA
jgi:hypothetical protein